MRLAANVAHTVDVGGMLDQMTLREFAEWEAFDRIDPIGNEGVCHVLALIGSLIAGLTGNKIGPSKFLPWVKTEDAHKPVTGKQIQSIVQGIFGGR